LLRLNDVPDFVVHLHIIFIVLLFRVCCKRHLLLPSRKLFDLLHMFLPVNTVYCLLPAGCIKTFFRVYRSTNTLNNPTKQHNVTVSNATDQALNSDCSLLSILKSRKLKTD